ASGGDTKDCAARAHEVKKQCILGCGKMPPPPCGENCLRDARAILEECLGQDGDPAACLSTAEDSLSSCLGECQAAKPPAPPRCMEGCKEISTHVFMECMDST